MPRWRTERFQLAPMLGTRRDATALPRSVATLFAAMQQNSTIWPIISGCHSTQLCKSVVKSRYDPGPWDASREIGKEMADALGIDQGTLDRWKTRHKEFRIAIQLGKIRADAEIAESLYNRARGMSLPAVKIFQGTPEAGPVIVPHQEHLPPDVGAAKLWLSRRQPERWKERQEVDVSGTLEHRLNQMTPEERAADAVELMARVRRRLAEYPQTIEHEPSPEPETEDQPRSQPPHRTRPGS